MRFVTVTLAALLLASACGGAPLYDRLADDTLEQAKGGTVIEAWPSVARRPYDGDTGGGMPPRFHDRTVVRGLVQPTAFRFSPDGRLFVAEQRGTVLQFDGIDDASPTTVVDIRALAYTYSLMGLLGLELDPDFPSEPYLYLAYTYDGPIAGQAPTYGTPDGDQDDCPVIGGKCVISGRISRIQLAADGSAGPEQVLVEDWCHDGGHSLGMVLFAPDGTLLAGAGDTASPQDPDYGQLAVPANACGDPPTAVGETPIPPTAEGGSLRSQDLRTRNDPVGLTGTIIRIDPHTGAGAPGNPLATDADPNARRVIAYGLRNPFRFTFRPGTSELWVADVGSVAYEEVNVIADALGGPLANLGWPCFEGPYQQRAFAATGFDVCTELYEDRRDLLFPYLSVARSEKGDAACDSGGAALTAIAFYDGTTFPDEYAGALFIGDSSRSCIWVMRTDDVGHPDVATIRQFHVGTMPVDMRVGPDGALYVLDYAGGALRRIQHYPGNQPPRGRVRGGPVNGPTPLTVTLDASRSTDADGDVLAYAWDIDRDGLYDDGAGASLTITLHEPGVHPIYLRVTDSTGEWDERTYTLRADPPSP